MAKFRFSVNVEPKDIPHLDDSHKRDVADVLTSIINHTFKRTLIIAIASIAFFAAFSLFSFTFYMRMGTLLPQLPAAMPIVCIAVVLAEFVAGTMNKPAVIIEIVLCLAMAYSYTDTYTICALCCTPQLQAAYSHTNSQSSFRRTGLSRIYSASDKRGGCGSQKEECIKKPYRIKSSVRFIFFYACQAADNDPSACEDN